MAARASPVAIQPSVAVLVFGFVFAQRDVLALDFTTYVKAMMVEVCVRQSLEATFGRAWSLFGHALLVSVQDASSSIFIYPFHARPKRDSFARQSVWAAYPSHRPCTRTYIVHTGGWGHA